MPYLHAAELLPFITIGYLGTTTSRGALIYKI